jgi:predicted adenylyl cyclase CyaB
MSEDLREIEVKFYVKDLKKLEARLRELGARLIQPRVHETNIRFDTPNRVLRRARQVLRLRRDDQIHLTYKGPSTEASGVVSRTEIEVTVDDFDKAGQILEALGFEKSFFYEKYRTTYELIGSYIMLDETQSADAIHDLTGRLGLDSRAAVAASYAALFERVRRAQKLKVADLSFENFKGREVSTRDLEVKAADE